MQEYWQANEDAHLIGPVADTYIERTANPDVANATGNNLLLHNTSGSTLYEAWLKFDLSDLDPEDTQVIEAMLVLYLKSNSDVGETGFELLGVTDDTWGESTPGGDVPDLDSLIAWVGFDSSDVGVYTRIEIDVTEYVQASVGEGLDYLVSFALVPDAEDSPMISAIIASHRTTGDLSDYISGLSVSVTVPEPMTLGFLAVAGLVAMLRRRCKCDEL
jgi:hypothetical protein